MGIRFGCIIASFEGKGDVLADVPGIDDLRQDIKFILNPVITDLKQHIAKMQLVEAEVVKCQIRIDRKFIVDIGDLQAPG